MKAVILVGGLGIRLRPLSIDTPKAMMPVINTPFLECVIRRLSQHNIRQIVLAISHLAQPIKGYLGDGSRFGVSLSYSIEEEALGTAGAVKNAEQYLDEAFLVLNGDIFTDLDITSMMAFHNQRQAKISIALTPVDDPTSYGLIETDNQGRVSRFLEKPGWEQITTNMINAGTYIMEADVLASIPRQTKFSFEREVFPPFLDRGEPIYAYPSTCYWMDIGTPEKYHQLNRDLLNGKSNQYTFGSDNRILIGQQGNIQPTANITGPVVSGNNCSIGQKAKLTGPLVIGSGSTIARDAIVEDCIMWYGVNIQPGATIRHSIIANNCHIGSGSVIEAAVISDNVTIADGYKLKPGSKIWPHTRLGQGL